LWHKSQKVSLVSTKPRCDIYSFGDMSVAPSMQDKLQASSLTLLASKLLHVLQAFGHNKIPLKLIVSAQSSRKHWSESGALEDIVSTLLATFTSPELWSVIEQLSRLELITGTTTGNLSAYVVSSRVHERLTWASAECRSDALRPIAHIFPRDRHLDPM